MDKVLPFALMATFLFVLELVALLRNRESWTLTTVLGLTRGIVHLVDEIFSPKKSMKRLERFVCGIAVFAVFVAMVIILCNGAFAAFQTNQSEGAALLCVGIPVLAFLFLMLFRFNRKHIARS